MQKNASRGVDPPVNLVEPRKPGLTALNKPVWKMLLLLAVAWLGYEIVSLPFGSIEDLKTKRPGETAMMQERKEEVEEEGRRFRIRQRWVSLNEIPMVARNAVIVAEDGTFWTHSGFDWFEIRESFERNLRDRKITRGGSTISQQLVKNLYLSSSRNPLRKLKEWILTWWLERTLSKRRILELYLNVIEWGDGIYGIEAASIHYFGKAASDLTREEAARLAAIIPSPRRLGSRPYSRYVDQMTQVILERMDARNM